MRGSATSRGGRRARIACILLFLILVGAGASNLLAFPAFARKYQTSCQTCHIAFPALTPFGEAFRLNGYRFPEGADASVAKVEPVPLGSEGYKKLWPEAVWPGEIPGNVPVSFIAKSEIVDDRTAHLTSFDGLGGALELQAAGTFGEHISFFGNYAIERSQGETTTDLERFFVLFRPFKTPAFQFKVGAFDPGLTLVSSHRSLLDADVGILANTVGDNGWTAEPAQDGIEFYGVVSHRLLYNAGLVEGAGNAPNNAKDYYARLAYKFGGLALDGFTPKSAEGGLPASPKPWSEKSVTVSAFVYKGSPLLQAPDTTVVDTTNPACPLCPVITIPGLTQNDDFTIYGGDLAWNFENLTVRAGASKRNDTSPVIGDPSITDVKSKNYLGELDWVAYPWLVPALRWESFDLSGDKTDKVTLAVNFLVRANVKAFLAADSLKESGGSYSTEEISGGVNFGF